MLIGIGQGVDEFPDPSAVAATDPKGFDDALIDRVEPSRLRLRRRCGVDMAGRRSDQF
jgi:hypothetical protein